MRIHLATGSPARLLVKNAPHMRGNTAGFAGVITTIPLSADSLAKASAGRAEDLDMPPTDVGKTLVSKQP